MQRRNVLEHSGRYGERDRIKLTGPGAQVFQALKLIDFPNQPFYLRPDSLELVLHYIPYNFQVNTKVVMN
jgi:hypothetical protein